MVRHTWLSGIWGVAQQLDLGVGHPLVGRSAPDFQLADGRRMGELLRAGQGVLLVFDAGTSLCASIEGCQRRPALIRQAVDDTLGLGAVLVRPDGIVAWACDAGGDGAGMSDALRRWFGSMAAG